MFIAPSGESSRWTEVQKPVSSFGVNFPTARCICFASALHSLLFPVNSGTYILSHPSSLTLLRDSNLLLLWYYAGFYFYLQHSFYSVLRLQPTHRHLLSSSQHDANNNFLSHISHSNIYIYFSILERKKKYIRCKRTKLYLNMPHKYDKIRDEDSWCDFFISLDKSIGDIKQ